MPGPSRRARVLALALLASALSAPSGAAPDAAELEALLGDRPATMVVLSPGKGGKVESLRLRPERAAERFSPCSTFKIPNSLIALAAGAVTPEDSRIAWDRRRDPRQEYWPDSWARDQDLDSALRNSVVWYYRELARRVGAEEMARQLERLDYGNRDISGGIDRFWLSSTLRISAEEQVRFLRRYEAGALGFEPAHEALVRRALVLEAGEGWVWRGKTGSCRLEDGRFLGWLVGWVETKKRTHHFALNVEAETWAEVRDLRFNLARKVLEELDLLPESEHGRPSRPGRWARPLPDAAGLPNLHRVSEGLYRGAQPEEEGFAELARLGVRTVVNLRTGRPERSDVEERGMRYVRIPIRAWAPTEAQLVDFLRVATDPESGPVFVHCRRGADRTGMVVAVYRVAVEGWSKEKALEEMWRGGYGFSPVWKNLESFVERLDVEALMKKVREEP